MAGFAIFSVLGFMAYEQNTDISTVAESGDWRSNLSANSNQYTYPGNVMLRKVSSLKQIVLLL